jgi:hypothetical protein
MEALWARRVENPHSKAAAVIANEVKQSPHYSAVIANLPLFRHCEVPFSRTEQIGKMTITHNQTIMPFVIIRNEAI